MCGPPGAGLSSALPGRRPADGGPPTNGSPTSCRGGRISDTYEPPTAAHRARTPVVHQATLDSRPAGGAAADRRRLDVDGDPMDADDETRVHGRGGGVVRGSGHRV